MKDRGREKLVFILLPVTIIPEQSTHMILVTHL